MSYHQWYPLCCFDLPRLRRLDVLYSGKCSSAKNTPIPPRKLRKGSPHGGFAIEAWISSYVTEPSEFLTMSEVHLNTEHQPASPKSNVFAFPSPYPFSLSQSSTKNLTLETNSPKSRSPSPQQPRKGSFIEVLSPTDQPPAYPQKNTQMGLGYNEPSPWIPRRPSRSISPERRHPSPEPHSLEANNNIALVMPANEVPYHTERPGDADHGRYGRLIARPEGSRAPYRRRYDSRNAICLIVAFVRSIEHSQIDFIRT